MSILFESKKELQAQPRQSIWHMISWMSTHEEYVTVGYVLAEYATKAALSHFLPEEKAHQYAEVLSMMGFDVDDDAGLGRVLKLAAPALGMDIVKRLASSSSHHSKQAEVDLGKRMMVGTTQTNLMMELKNRVKTLHDMPPNEPKKGAHDEFADFLLSQKKKEAVGSYEAMHEHALRVYGGCTWFDAGLSCLLNKMMTTPSQVQTKEQVSLWLMQSYNKWRLWGKRWWPSLHGFHADLPYI